MSNIAAAATIIALGVAHFFVYVVVDQRVRNETKLILRGVDEGIPISTQDRWMWLWTFWFASVTGGVGFQIVIAAVWFFLGSYMSADGLRLLAYLGGFFISIGAVAWVHQGTVWFFRLRSVLRQAEAD